MLVQDGERPVQAVYIPHYQSQENPQKLPAEENHQQGTRAKQPATSIIIYPLTARVVGAPQMILQSIFSIFPVLYCPLGLAELQVCPFPDIVFLPLPLSALSSFPFHCALQEVVARSDEPEICPYHLSLRLFTMGRRFSYGPIASLILAWFQT